MNGVKASLTLRRLRAVRWAVRATLTLGVAASVAANILHAETNPISQSIAAWPPLALLLTVELISRVPVHKRSLAAARLVATATIAGIAAWVSYWHMVGVAAHYGETGASPYLMPISVDGLVVVASVSLVELAGRIRAAEQPDPIPAATTIVPDGHSTPDGVDRIVSTLPVTSGWRDTARTGVGHNAQRGRSALVPVVAAAFTRPGDTSTEASR